MFASAKQKRAGADPDWKAEEAKSLTNIKAVTKEFARAGEGYFSPDGKKIIYQAEEKETGNPFYQIFVQELDTGKFHRVSPGKGRTTCAYFHPTNGRILFSSSHGDPARTAVSFLMKAKRTFSTSESGNFWP